MRKLLTTTLLLASVTAFANNTVNTKETHNFSVKLEGFTQNTNLNESSKKLNVGYEVEGKYKINKNFSATMKGIMYGRNRYALVPGIGAEMDLTKHFTPYARVEIPFNLYKGRNQRFVDYEVGLKYKVYQGMYLFGESHEFFEVDKAGYEAGIGFPVTKSLIFSASYHTQIKGHYNGLTASFEYLV